MHPALQLLRQHLIHHPVLPHTRHATKRISHDFDTEVAFTRRVATGMTCVLITLINHAKSDRVEGGFQFFFKGSAYRA